VNGDIRNVTPQWMIDLGNTVNITAFSNMRDVRYMRSLNMRSEWLEIWIDEKIFTPIGVRDLTVKPIVFFGNSNDMGFPLAEFRLDMCKALKSKYSDFGFYGNAPNSDGNFNHSQEAEAAAYRNTKIAINVSHFEVEQYSSDMTKDQLIAYTTLFSEDEQAATGTSVKRVTPAPSSDEGLDFLDEQN